MIEFRKKCLPAYLKYKASLDRGDKIDKRTQDMVDEFLAVNSELKRDLPQLYAKTKLLIGATLQSLLGYQLTWWDICQRKIRPLLDPDPALTDFISADLHMYMVRFQSDFGSVLHSAQRLGILNRGLLNEVGKITSPSPSLYADDSSRKSTSKRTQSLSSEASTLDAAPPRTSASGRISAAGGAIRTPSDFSDRTMMAMAARMAAPPGSGPYDVSPNEAGVAMYAQLGRQPASMSSTLYDASLGNSIATTVVPPLSAPPSAPPPPTGLAYHRMSTASTGSGAALPPSAAEVPADLSDPRVLFLAASLFEFNIAHDRREAGFPYLVYVTGEVFDVVGVRGELWLARNQDDSSRTYGWIWEKHFARILADDM